MANTKRRVFSLALCMILSSFLIFCFLPSNNVWADSGYYIKNYDVDVKVNADRSYDITETIDVYFTEESHGIIRDIPTWASEEREVRLQNVSVEGAEFEHDGYGEIKIGSADEYVKGDMRYVIKYTLWHYADEYDDYDYMYLNVIGTQWDTYIDNYTSTITLPDGAEINKITLTSGSYGSTSDEFADYSVDGNIIKITSKQSLSAYEGVTINVQMKEGAFPEAKVWEPDLYIHNIDVEANLEENGNLHVKEVFDVTVNSPSGMSITVKDYDEDYNSQINNMVITYPDGKTDRTQLHDKYCYLDFYNYEGRRISVSMEYDKQYYVKKGQDTLRVEQMILPADSDIIAENVNVKVEMPFTINEDSVKIGEIYGYYNKYDQDTTEVFAPDRKSVEITNADKIDTDNYSYLVFETNDGNFDMGYSPAGEKMLAASFIIIAVACVMMFTKRKNKYFPVVEFYPPDGMTPAEMGYIIDAHLSNRDMVSMIYYWASKGYLDIVYLDKKDFYLKRKTYSIGGKAFEQALFRGLWLGKRDTAFPSDLKERYYRYINSAIKSIENSYGGKGSLISKWRIVSSVIFGYILPSLFITISSIYALAVLGKSATGNGFMIAAMVALMWLIYSMGKKIHKNAFSPNKGFTTTICTLVGVISAMLIMYYYTMCVGNFLFGNEVALAVAFINCLIIFFSQKIKRRSDWGEELLNKTLGFRMFLETAESERLRMLCDENPQYFYDILPYAQVLGITKKWIKLFDEIGIPPAEYVESAYYDSRFDYHMFNHMTSRISSASKSMPASSGDSGGGGGFSSGGGMDSGGFSGGGSGGGGGSRW